MPPDELRAELHRLLLDETAGGAAELAPRMLADPASLTPELRWCLVYLLRGVGCVASRNRILDPGTLLHAVAHMVEASRLVTESVDRHWHDVARDLPGHWLTRYEAGDRPYSLEELHWLNALLARLWIEERERLIGIGIPTFAEDLRERNPDFQA